MVAALKPGSKVTLEVWRDGKAKELTATVGELEDKTDARSRDKDERGKGKLGVAVRPLSPEEKKAASSPAASSSRTSPAPRRRPACGRAT